MTTTLLERGRGRQKGKKGLEEQDQEKWVKICAKVCAIQGWRDAWNLICGGWILGDLILCMVFFFFRLDVKTVFASLEIWCR